VSKREEAQWAIFLMALDRLREIHESASDYATALLAVAEAVDMVPDHRRSDGGLER
jgi:hypothetical protein